MHRSLPFLLLLPLIFAAYPAQATCDPNAVITRVSLAFDGSQADGSVGGGAVSVDGRYTVFSTHASNLVPDDTNAKTDVFLYDRLNCAVTRVSIDTATQSGGYSADISPDGRYIVYGSTFNAANDLYLYDRQTGVHTEITSSLDIGAGSTPPLFSPDSQYLAYARTENAGTTSQTTALVLLNRLTNQFEKVDVTLSGGSPTDGNSTPVGIWGNGRYVMFQTWSSQLVSGDAPNSSDLFLRDLQTDSTTRLMAANGEAPNGNTTGAAVSSDGRWVAFSSLATNFTVGDDHLTCDVGSGSLTNCYDVFLLDRQTGATTIISRASGGALGNGNSGGVDISANGRYISYYSNASNLVVNDTNGQPDVFVYDRETATTRRVSVTADGSQAGAFVLGPGKTSISSDGRYVAFESASPGLVSGDTYECDTFYFQPPLNCPDVFLVNLGLPPANMIDNSDFSSGMANWLTFDAITHRLSNGVFEFYRNTGGVSAVVFQETGAALPQNAALEVSFRLGNSSAVRKRVVALLHDGDFSDLAVCSFWLPPATPLRPYTMTAQTTEVWSSATISFYASPGDGIGWIQLDDVSLTHDPALTVDFTRCVDAEASG